ncbi:hypothetical protein E3Q23_00166 [Wallemia mellicola]|nr:hypothetical protein E3Q23_00166 [Wallemia mellicola]
MEQLYRAIKSAHETDDVLLRLMKKGAIPTLNLSISTLSHYNSRFTIEQDVPCRPQKQIYVDTFDQPAIPERNVGMSHDTNKGRLTINKGDSPATEHSEA